jgi:Mn2+/Fe2+ NRAMP family transporter
MMAVLFQILAIRLELVTGKRLAQVHSFAPSIVLVLSFWVPLFLCVE